MNTTSTAVSVHVGSDAAFTAAHWDDPKKDQRGRYTLKIDDACGPVTLFLEPDDLVRLSETLAAFVAEQRGTWPGTRTEQVPA